MKTRNSNWEHKHF